MTVRIINGDCREVLKALKSDSVDCVVTSPPYFGLRDYGVDAQLGLESTPFEFVENLVGVFREVRRVLKSTGSVWLNLGDSYTASGKGGNPEDSPHQKQNTNRGSLIKGTTAENYGLGRKQLIGIPWRVALALQANGWYLRNDIIWAKPNGMPESVQDRATRAHEYVFHLTKSDRYYYNSEAARTPPKPSSETRLAPLTGEPSGRHGLPSDVLPASERRTDKQRGHSRKHKGFNDRWDAMEKSEQQSRGANLRTVWWLSPAQFGEAHYAVMPESLAELCITCGCPKGGTVLDPFGGAGTTALVADRMGHSAISIELNVDNVELQRKRIVLDAGLFTSIDCESSDVQSVADGMVS